jgi:hypothetical protein
MANDKRPALRAAIRARIEMANYLLPIAQRLRFPGCAQPPMMFHWCDDWDDMPLSELLEVCAYFDGVVARLEKWR